VSPELYAFEFMSNPKFFQMTKKFVINRCYGGFSLSEEGLNLYNSLSEKTLRHSHDINRDDPFLIEVVETLGEKADGSVAQLEIVIIPEDLDFEITEYDGMEDYEIILKVGILDLINGFNASQLELAQFAHCIKLI
jgi:hypothetical protein